MKQRKVSNLILILLLTGWCGIVSGQEVAVKTNILYWATTTPNVSVETALTDRMTLDLEFSFNPWKFGSNEDNKKIQHWILRPELRRWLHEKYAGHFLGVNALYGRYNAGGVKLPLGILKTVKDSRYEGYATGAGISYGYQWKLLPRWSLEATVGVGYLYLNYDRYECQLCGDHIKKDKKHYFGPTRAGVSMVYLF